MHLDCDFLLCFLLTFCLLLLFLFYLSTFSRCDQRNGTYELVLGGVRGRSTMKQLQFAICFFNLFPRFVRGLVNLGPQTMTVYDCWSFVFNSNS
jgi:hypothetical protein